MPLIIMTERHDNKPKVYIYNASNTSHGQKCTCNLQCTHYTREIPKEKKACLAHSSKMPFGCLSQ